MLGVGRAPSGYQIVRRLGEGGMGEVYLARRIGAAGFERPVALKIVRAALDDDPRARQRFEREARVLAALHHRAIVQVFGLEAEEGRLVLVMEYLHGVTLRRLGPARGPMPWPLVAFAGAEVARGLEAAHSLSLPEAPRGLVHRDLSPSNVMACVDGAVKILDFGLARPTEEAPSVSGVEGKLPYLAPELVAGFPPDASADLYSLGVMLHELLTGELLFRGESELETMHRLLHEVVPPPSAKVPGIPGELDALVLALVSRDRARRPVTAAQVAAALEALPGTQGAAALAGEVRRALAEEGRPIEDAVTLADHEQSSLTPATRSIGPETRSVGAETRSIGEEPREDSPARGRARVLAAPTTLAPVSGRPRWLLAGLGLLIAAGAIAALVLGRGGPPATAVGPPPPARDAAIVTPAAVAAPAAPEPESALEIPPEPITHRRRPPERRPARTAQKPPTPGKPDRPAAPGAISPGMLADPFAK